MQVPNLGFDDWVMKNEKTWYPNATLDDADHFWDSGNEGASIASRNPTAPETGDVVKGRAVRMASDYISIASKFAAGNIYTGDFVVWQESKGLNSISDSLIPDDLRH